MPKPYQVFQGVTKHLEASLKKLVGNSLSVKEASRSAFEFLDHLDKKGRIELMERVGEKAILIKELAESLANTIREDYVGREERVARALAEAETAQSLAQSCKQYPAHDQLYNSIRCIETASILIKSAYATAHMGLPEAKEKLLDFYTQDYVDYSKLHKVINMHDHQDASVKELWQESFQPQIAQLALKFQKDLVHSVMNGNTGIAQEKQQKVILLTEKFSGDTVKVSGEMYESLKPVCPPNMVAGYFEEKNEVACTMIAVGKDDHYLASYELYIESNKTDNSNSFPSYSVREFHPYCLSAQEYALVNEARDQLFCLPIEDFTA